MLNANVLDTLKFESSKILFKKYHLARTQEAFRFLCLPIEDQKLTACYDLIEADYAGKLQEDECLRIIFQRQNPGAYHTNITKIEKINSQIGLAPLQLTHQPPPGSAFKWDNREFWNSLFLKKPPLADDILIVGHDNEVIESSRFNIFCFDSSAVRVFTPPLASGCLNGAFRRFVLDQAQISLPSLGKISVTEKKITLSELRKYRLFVGNSVRGVLEAHLFH